MSTAASTKAHPLAGNSDWVFSQPLLGLETTYSCQKDGEVVPMHIAVSNTCREGIIYDVRATLRNQLTNLLSLGHLRWNEKTRALAQKHEADLEDSQPAELWIRWGGVHMNSFPEGGRLFPVEKFLKVCDVVLGPVCVLLGPQRRPGDWWKTDPVQARQRPASFGSEFVYWSGSDNWFLAHPVTVSIATGLYRQCFHLCRAGMADEVLKSVAKPDIEETLSTCSQKLALRVVKKTRPFIEVPVGSKGSRVNYSFAKGFWRRLIRLQRAIRRGGYEEALGQTFADGWELVGEINNRSCTGIYSFWGDNKLTDKHRHLMRMGEPRRGRGADQSAAETAR